MNEIQRRGMNGKHKTLGVYHQNVCELRDIEAT